MNTASDLIRLTSDLAAHWTEPVLELLKRAGIERLTVDAEIEVWHTLKRALHSELRGQQPFRRSTLEPLSSLMERVILRTAEQLTRRIQRITSATLPELRRRAGERVATPAERVLYTRIIREPAVREVFQPVSRTDMLPRLRVSTVAG